MKTRLLELQAEVDRLTNPKKEKKSEIQNLEPGKVVRNG